MIEAGLSPTRIGTAIAAGAVLSLAYSLSPLTIWFLVLVAAMAWLAAAGVEGSERRWLLRIVGAAVVLRLVALAAFFVVTRRWDGSFAPLLPDESYIALRSLLLRDIALNIPIAPENYVDSFSAYGRTNLHYVFALIEVWLGPASFGLRLVNTAHYLAGALLLYRTTRPAFGPLAALIGLTLMLFLPTLFIWSISLVKEAPFACLLSVSVAAAAAASRRSASGWGRRLAATVVLVTALFLLQGLRESGGLMVGGGIAVGAGAAFVLRRPVLAALAGATLVAVVAGVIPVPSRVSAAIDTRLDQFASVHIGHVETRGYGYRLLDPASYFFRDSVAAITPASRARFVLRALASVVLTPLPWQASSAAARAILPEQVAWYGLVLLAVPGLVAAVRREPRLALMLAGVVAVCAAAVGLTNGNIGTLVRIRSVVVVPTLWLSAIGVCVVIRAIVAGHALMTHMPVSHAVRA
jgi:hypothetical protein